ncbi:MAG: helix-turn-helix domain-containing protein [Dehalococcoidia bacterium]
MVNLKKLRESFGVSQTAMASKFGVCLRTYQNWEYDKVAMPGPALKVMDNLQERYVHPGENNELE